MDEYTEAAARSVVQALELEMVDECGESTSLTADFGYESADPYAVSATFHTSRGDVVWAFARELLATGLLEPNGDGDVHIWPSLSNSGNAAVIIEICSPTGGSALLQADSRDVFTFLALTDAIVKPGMEANYLDLDNLLRSILGTDPGAAQESVATRAVPSNNTPD
jgi:hypothetical protein